MQKFLKGVKKKPFTLKKEQITQRRFNSACNQLNLISNYIFILSPLIFLCFTRSKSFKINAISFCAFKIHFLDIFSFGEAMILKVVYTMNADLEIETRIQIPASHCHS